MIVIEFAGLWLGRPGTVQYLDSLVDEFMTKKTGGEQNIILDKAREFRDVNATEDELMKSSLYYIKLFVSNSLHTRYRYRVIYQ